MNTFQQVARICEWLLEDAQCTVTFVVRYIGYIDVFECNILCSVTSIAICNIRLKFLIKKSKFVFVLVMKPFSGSVGLSPLVL
jgi:hypothetical protein